MSEGRSTQSKMDMVMWASIAGGIVFLLLFLWPPTQDLSWIMVGVLLLIGLLYLTFRCPECGLSVRKEADGSKSRSDWWPKANPRCAKCGADIP